MSSRERESEIVCGLGATENNNLNGCGKMWRTWKRVLCQVVPVCVCVCACAHACVECQIIQTPGWHGRVRELAYNEGDVPQLLPVSDGSLNQEWREKLTLLANKSPLLSRQMWVCGCVCFVWVHKFWITGFDIFFDIFYPNSLWHTFMQTRAMFI